MKLGIHTCMSNPNHNPCNGCHSDSPKSEKFKQSQSARKIMAIDFWDQEGVLFVDFMELGTITMEVNWNIFEIEMFFFHPPLAAQI